jgi:hypothetical protein
LKSQIKNEVKKRKMKKTTFTLALFFLATGISFASKNPIEDEKKDNSKVSETKTEETTFITQMSEDSQKLKVSVSGIKDPYASISVTNQRGATIQCAFINEQTNEFNFDLSKLEKGNYNVMLITDQEIRIKRIQID